jgi:hypothetical protein
MRPFPKALNFSLNDYSYLMLHLVKNKALEHSSGSVRSHLSFLKLLVISVSLLLADRPFIISFGGHLVQLLTTHLDYRIMYDLPLRRDEH